MIRLEKSLQGYPQIAKQMTEHLPGKTAKQIRDKRREPSYKAIVEQYIAQRSTATEPQESICSISESAAESGPVPTRRYVSETEDELFSDQGEVYQQPNPSSSGIGENSTERRNSTELERQLGLNQPADEGSPPSQEEETDLVTRTESPTCPIGAGNYPSNDDRARHLLDGDAGVTTSNETQWRNEVIRQALADTRETSALPDKCRDLHLRLVSTLKKFQKTLM